MTYYFRTVMGCSKIIAFTVDTFERRELIRPNFRRVMTGVITVNAAWPTFADLTEMPTKACEAYLALGINGRIGYLQLKK